MMTEYLRRNLNVARVIGASAGAKTALERLAGTKKPPKWLIAQLDGIQSRLIGLSAELAAWRDTATDALDYAASPAPPKQQPVHLTGGECGGVQWQPIETAPKDCQIVMYWVDSVRFAEHEETGQLHEIDVSQVDFGCWMDGGEHGDGYHDPFGGVPGDQGGVTHWMPLPPPPAPRPSAPTGQINPGSAGQGMEGGV